MRLLPFVHLERAAPSPAAAGFRPPAVIERLSAAAESAAWGSRSLADLIAPAALAIATDHLVLDGQFARILSLVGLPPAADPGWLEPLVAEALPAEVALFLEPANVGMVAGQMAHRHVRLQLSLGHDAADGRPADPDLVAAEEQTARLRHALARGAERPFRAALYILLRARSRAELDARTRVAQDALAALNGRLAIARLQQEAGLAACLPGRQDALRLAPPPETSSLVTAYPFPPAELHPPNGVPLGFDRRTGAPVSLDVFDDRVCRNANIVVFGPGGTGKSYDVKLLLLRTLLLDDRTDVLVVDPKHEY